MLHELFVEQVSWNSAGSVFSKEKDNVVWKFWTFLEIFWFLSEPQASKMNNERHFCSLMRHKHVENVLWGCILRHKGCFEPPHYSKCDKITASFARKLASRIEWNATWANYIVYCCQKYTIRLRIVVSWLQRKWWIKKLGIVVTQKWIFFSL